MKATPIRNYDSILKPKTIEELRIKAYQNPHREVCGFITKSQIIIDVENIADDPKHEFFMSPNSQYEIMRTYKNNILGIWHTHPSGIPYPSEKDTLGAEFGLPLDYWYWVVTTEYVYQYIWSTTEINVRGITTV